MNGGGAPVELHTTNGGIRIRSRSDAGEVKTDDEPAVLHDLRPRGQ